MTSAAGSVGSPLSSGVVNWEGIGSSRTPEELERDARIARAHLIISVLVKVSIYLYTFKCVADHTNNYEQVIVSAAGIIKFENKLMMKAVILGITMPLLLWNACLNKSSCRICGQPCFVWSPCNSWHVCIHDIICGRTDKRQQSGNCRWWWLAF